MTYAELEERANRLAWALRGRGVGLETRVGICLERTVDLPVALLGVLKAGGVYVPLDAEYPEERLRYLAKDSGVAVVVTQASLAAKLRGATDAGLLQVDADWAEEVARQRGDEGPEGVGRERTWRT